MLKSKLSYYFLKYGALLGLPLLIGIVYFYSQEFELIAKTPREAWEKDLTADCAVVLTGGPGRVKEGLDLLIRKQVQRVVIAGVNPQVSLRDLYPQLPLYPQVNEEDIVLERSSETTYGNAQQAELVFLKNDKKNYASCPCSFIHSFSESIWSSGL